MFGIPSVEELIATLENPNEEVRMTTVRALATISHESVPGPMFRALRHANPHVRQGVAQALATSRDPRVICELAQCLIDEIAANRLLHDAIEMKSRDTSGEDHG